MNERIKELAGQANSDLDGAIPFGFAEKFAELIIRECAKIADRADESKCEWIGGNILMQLGVSIESE